MNANFLQVLRPYKDQGSVFDDPSVGLVREPFVFGRVSARKSHHTTRHT